MNSLLLSYQTNAALIYNVSKTTIAALDALKVSYQHMKNFMFCNIKNKLIVTATRFDKCWTEINNTYYWPVKVRK